MNEKLTARLVYDGGDEVYIPPELGTPRDDQMQGTPSERLVELAGRCCYDSLGSGRPSFDSGEMQGYHSHIKQVQHGCYDIETDVLTVEGWKSWPDVTKDDKLATRTLSGKIEYHHPSRLIEISGYKGRMLRVQSNGGRFIGDA